MTIYTGTGDRGKTSLFSGQRVSKAHERIEALGNLDELNSIIGGLIAALSPEYPELIDEIQRIQSDLFNISALLATTPDSPSMDTIEGITKEQIETLENAIDRMDKVLPELKCFVLPGGHMTAAWSHLARTVCRRSERQIVRFLATSFNEQGSDPYQKALIYINRLSDYLFVAARYCNHVLGVPEQYWKC
jgi:cob(I)alamin adenosyltransferase